MNCHSQRPSAMKDLGMRLLLAIPPHSRMTASAVAICSHTEAGTRAQCVSPEPAADDDSLRWTSRLGKAA
jgi:hypothetical protein